MNLKHLLLLLAPFVTVLAASTLTLTTPALAISFNGSFNGSTGDIQTQVKASSLPSQPDYAEGQLIVKVMAAPISAETEHPQAEQGMAVFDAIASLSDLNHHYEVTAIDSVLDIAATDETAQQFGLDRIYRLTVPIDTDIWQMAAAYASDPHVEYAEPNLLLAQRELPSTQETLLTQEELAAATVDPLIPNDPYFSKQDNLYNNGQTGGSAGADVNALGAWQVQTGTASIVVAVIDTGVSPLHPDLQGKLLSEIDYDFIQNDLEPQDSSDHGTRVASVIAANTNNGVGIAGMCWLCRLLPLRVGKSVIHLATLEVAKAIYYAASIPVDVINMSLGGQCSQLWADVVNYAYARDVVLVAAAGNVVGFVAYPARFERVMAVSAVDNQDHFATFSSFGSAVDVAAPGADILVADRHGTISRGSGTSYASALTAGIAGLLRAANPTLTNAEVYEILRATAVDLGRPGFDPRYGFGRVNAGKALQVALNPPAPAQLPPLDRCSCILEELNSTSDATAAPQQANAPSASDVLHRVRDDLFASSAFGQEITDLYYRHSSQVAYLAFEDAELRHLLQASLEMGLPYAVSALDGDGAQILDQSVISQTNALVDKLAAQANPELGTDLLRIWRSINLAAFVGQPVRAVVAHLAQMSEPQQRDHLFLPFVEVDTTR